MLLRLGVAILAARRTLGGRARLRDGPAVAALEAKYREIAKGIGSDYDRRRAEDALRERG